MKIIEHGSQKRRNDKIYLDQTVYLAKWHGAEEVMALSTLNNQHLYYPDRHFDCRVELTVGEIQLILERALKAGLIHPSFTVSANKKAKGKLSDK